MARCITVAIVALITASGMFPWGGLQPVSAAWTPYSCYGTVQQMPISPNGFMNVSGCMRWEDDFRFQVFSSTSTTVNSYVIYTRSEGFDRCLATDPWIKKMEAFVYTYNTTYTTSPAVIGYYQNCSLNHDYLMYAVGSRKRYSFSSWEWGEGYKVWP